MTRDESRDAMICTNYDRSPSFGGGGHVLEPGTEHLYANPHVRYVPIDQLESAERERDEALARVRKLEAVAEQRELDFGHERTAFTQIRNAQQASVLRLQAYVATLEPLAKAYREIGEKWLSVTDRDKHTVRHRLSGFSSLLDRAAEFTKKASGT